MSLAILPRHTEGRLEFLEDRKGIYGLTWPDPYHADQDPHCYILRPDRLEEERHCPAATLHPLPRNAGMFRNTVEFMIQRDLAKNMVVRAGLVNMEQEAFQEPSVRRRYWGLVNRAARISNGLIARLIEEAADPEALRIARRYPPEFRMGIYRMAATEPRLRQLAETFPAAAAIMAVRPGERALQARSAVLRGSRLAVVADELGWPLAFRKIPPGAVRYLLGIRHELLTRPEIIHRHLPQTLPEIRRWLAALHLALERDGPFVEWVARNAPAMGRTMVEVQTLVSDISDWVRASYVSEVLDLPPHILKASSGLSWRAPRELGAALVTRRFHPDMSLKTVLQLSDEWHEAIAMAQPEGQDVTFPPPWLPGGEVEGFEVVPITTGADLWMEGRAMRHCVATLKAEVLGGARYIYSLRRDGERVATFEMLRQGKKAVLGQIRGHCNANVPKEVEAAVRKWLRKAGEPKFPPRPEKPANFFEFPF